MQKSMDFLHTFVTSPAFRNKATTVCTAAFSSVFCATLLIGDSPAVLSSYSGIVSAGGGKESPKTQKYNPHTEKKKKKKKESCKEIGREIWTDPGQGYHKCESLTGKKQGRIRGEDKGYRDITRGAIQTAIFLGNTDFF